MKHPLLSLIACLFSLSSFASVSDSLQQKMESEIRAALKKQVEENKRLLKIGEKSKTNFVIEWPSSSSTTTFVDSDPDRIADTALNADGAKFLTRPETKSKINTELQKIFNDFQIETYVLLINYLEIQYSALLSEDIRVDSVFNGTGEKYKPEIMRNNVGTHYALNKKLMQGRHLFNGDDFGLDHNIYVLSVGKYIGRSSGSAEKLFTYYYWMFDKYQKVGNPQIEHFAEYYDFCKTKIKTNSDINIVFNSSNPDEGVYRMAHTIAYSLNFSELKNEITTVCNSDSLLALFHKFQNDQEYEHLDNAQRIHTLRVFLGNGVMNDFFAAGLGEEDIAIKILCNVKKSDYPQFLKMLLDPVKPPQGVNQCDGIYHAGALQGNILGGLVAHTDDAPMEIGADNFTLLCRAIAKMVLASPAIIDEYSKTLWQSEPKKSKFIFPWDKTYTFSAFSQPPPGTFRYSVSCNDNCMISVDRDQYTGTFGWAGNFVGVTSGLPDPMLNWKHFPDGQQTLHPYQLVIFTNQSDLSPIENCGLAAKQGVPVPALILYFASKKQLNQDIGTGVGIVIDVATLAIGIGEISVCVKAARWAALAVEVLDVTAAAGTIALSTGGISDDGAKEVVNSYNNYVGLLTLGNALTTPSTDFDAALNVGLQKGSNFSAPAGLETAGREFAQAYGRYAGNVDQYLDAPTKLRLQKTNELIRKAGVMDNAVFSASDAVRTIENASVKSVHIGAECKFYKGTDATSAAQIAHTEGGKLVLDQATALSPSVKQIDAEISSVEFKLTGDPNYKMDGVAIGTTADGTRCIIPGLCFPGKYLVKTKNGKRKISTLAIGDEVAAFDFEENKVVYKKVIDTICRMSRQLVKVFAGKECIEATPNHPFFVGRKQIQAVALKAGMLLTLFSGQTLAVDSVRLTDTLCKVYNIEVQDAHTYYVGEREVLVHNASCTKLKVDLFNYFGVNNYINYKNILEELDGNMLRGWMSKALQQQKQIDFLEKLKTNSTLLEDFKKDLTKYNGLTEDLAEGGDYLEYYVRIKEDPAQFFDFAKEIGKEEELFAFGRSQFFKEVVGKGRKFEGEVVLPALKNRSSSAYQQLKIKFQTDFGKNLDDYDLFSQVQLYYDGDKYFIADQVFVKYDAFDDVEDIVVIENKLRETTALTGPQSGAFTKNSFKVRSNDLTSEYLNSDKILKKSTSIQFSGNIQWIKVYDSDNGNVITGMKKM